jgi:signal transduction histidine kinase
VDITLVFFIYGLAFFTMGLALLFEASRTPLLAESSVLLLLATFGFVHGSHEWLEMFIDKSDWMVFRNVLLVNWLRIVVLSISFISLLVFGLRMLNLDRRLSQREAEVWIAGVLFYLAVVYLIGFSPWSGHFDRLTHLDAVIRYWVAVPASVLTWLALRRRANQAQRLGRPTGLATGLRAAAWGFLVYALTQLVVSPLDMFPANLLNQASFIEMTGMPVQVVRAAMAVVITIGMIWVLRAVEQERREQFLAAQQARVVALEQVQKDLIEREALRQELMRHTVLAQEDERARIARELHDETSQILTAFSFHLAALRQIKGLNARVKQQVDYLQGLSRQMSLGIYRLVHDLRPAQLDDLGLVAALLYLVDERQQRTWTSIKMQVIGERRRLDPLVETVIFRVAQEALTNVSRHAQVDDAEMVLEFGQDEVKLRVIDRGVGFDPALYHVPGKGWGLAGMRERIDSIGGKLVIESAPGKGTRIEIVVPIEPSADQVETASQDMVL